MHSKIKKLYFYSKYGNLENEWESSSPRETYEKKDDGTEAGIKPEKKKRRDAGKRKPSIPTQVVTGTTLDCVYFANKEYSFEHEKEKLSDIDPGLEIRNMLDSKATKVLGFVFHPEKAWICVYLENGVIQM